MANVKLSELPGAATADAADLVQIVQGGVNKNASVTKVLATHADSDGSTHTYLDQAVTIASTPQFTKVGVGLANTDGTLHVHTATAGDVTAATGADDLVVENSTDGGISILSPNTSVARINFGDTDANDVGQVIYNHSSDTLSLATGGVSALNVDISQQIGVGISAPDATLHVHTATAGGVTPSTFADDLVVENSGNAGITIAGGAADFASLYFADAGDPAAAYMSYDLNSDIMYIGVNAVTAMTINSTHDLKPSVTETQDLGSASLEWNNIYVQNAVTVSDLRRKEDIVDIIDPLTFVNSLRPVQYKLKDTVVPEVPAVLFDEGEVITKAKSAILDEEGEVVTPAVEEVIATGTEVKKEAIPEKTISHSRPHTGFIAQEVKEAIGENDWAGYAYDEDSDTHMLRLNEFIGYLVGAVKELSAKVEALEV